MMPILKSSATIFAEIWQSLGGTFRDDVPVGFYISKQESIYRLTRLRRWLIRAVYFGCRWASDFSKHSCSIFITLPEAELAAELAANETGEMYCVKELPVNIMLPPDAVNFGYQKFFHSDINLKYQSRVLDVVKVSDVASNLKQARRVTEILKSATL